MHFGCGNSWGERNSFVVDITGLPSSMYEPLVTLSLKQCDRKVHDRSPLLNTSKFIIVFAGVCLHICVLVTGSELNYAVDAKAWLQDAASGNGRGDPLWDDKL